MGKYDDIINLPHHVSTKHLQMPVSDRAAQFSSFAALTGHEAAIAETARLTDARLELDESRKEELDERLQIIREYILLEPEITVTYFVPDDGKEGGVYLQAMGAVKKLDDTRNKVIMKNGTIIPMKDILGMEGAVFDHIDKI